MVNLDLKTFRLCLAAVIGDFEQFKIERMSKISNRMSFSVLGRKQRSLAAGVRIYYAHDKKEAGTNPSYAASGSQSTIAYLSALPHKQALH